MSDNKKNKFSNFWRLAVVLSFILILTGCGSPVYPTGSQSLLGSDALANLTSGESPAQVVGFHAGYQVEDNIVSASPLMGIVAMFIKFFLSFLGVIFFFLIIYSGWLWLTAGGNEEQITKAKGLIKQAVVGLAIIFAAYAIVVLITQLAGGSSGAGGWWSGWIPGY